MNVGLIIGCSIMLCGCVLALHFTLYFTGNFVDVQLSVLPLPRMVGKIVVQKRLSKWGGGWQLAVTHITNGNQIENETISNQAV